MVCFPNSWLLPTSEGFRPQKIDKLAKSRTANWFQPQCWSKCGNEGRSRVGQEGHRWDQTDSRELLHALHAPKSCASMRRPHWMLAVLPKPVQEKHWWDTEEKPNKQTEHQRESVRRAGWRCRKWNPCGQQSCPLPLAKWSPADVLHTENAAQCSAPEPLNLLHKGMDRGKDTWSGLRKFP